MKGDILDANATTELAKSIHMPDIDKINQKLEQTVSKDQIDKPNGVAGLDSNGNIKIDQLTTVDTDLFIVVSELPTKDIKEGKIYCIKDTSSTAQDNGYIEYAYINNKWEKIGQFQAEPDLSGYAKLSGATFTGNVATKGLTITGDWGNLDFVGVISGRLPRLPNTSADTTNVFSTGGSSVNVGSSENFVFTLEDGSTVTKSIRVISTTTNQAEA